MHILFCASELTPLAKVGGLADVAGSLPVALHDLGENIRVCIPYYDIIRDAKLPTTKLLSDIRVPLAHGDETIDVYKAAIPGSNVPLYLIDNPTYLGDGGIYYGGTAVTDQFKGIQRFLFFSKAVVEMVRRGEMNIDVLHCNDWHTASIPTFLQEADMRIPTLYTIHSLGNQGIWKRKSVSGWLGTNIDTWAGDATNINNMEQGILTASYVSTVSPTYAKEIMTPEYGENIENSLHKRRKKLVGILNGIDQKRFNPEDDPDIAHPFAQDKVFEGKKANKRALQKMYALPEKDVPVIGIVTRLTERKGINLIVDILPQLFKRDVQIVVLGTGDPKLEEKLRDAHEKYPEQCGVKIAFDAKLAQQIYAGTDMFWVPSRYEPSGLTQMIAMRYGSPPIVRATGGLKDSVTNYSADTPDGRGFVFNDYTGDALLGATMRALDVYADTAQWSKVIANGFAYDSSWATSAKEYARLYEKIISS